MNLITLILTDILGIGSRTIYLSLRLINKHESANKVLSGFINWKKRNKRFL